MKYARIVNNFAVDVRTDPPDGCFTPDIVAEFVTVPDEVENGWSNESGAWTAPALPQIAAIEQPSKPILSPVQFKMCFTSAERIAIKAAKASDPILVDGFDLLEDPRLTAVDLNLASVQELIDYITSLNILTPQRAAEVKAGKIL